MARSVHSSIHWSLTFFLRFLPNHIKRLMFWVALSEKLENRRDVKMGGVEKINETLHLAKKPEAVMVPVKTAAMLWDELDEAADAVVGSLKGDTDEPHPVDFADTVPGCLRYASDRFIEEDFKRVIGSVGSASVKAQYKHAS